MTWLALPRRIALVGLLLALTVRGAASPPQIIPTNGSPEGPRTGMIAGQVVDATGTPVPEAIVRLAMPKFLENLPTTPKGRVMADGEGRYFFADLPAGDYYLQASKDGYANGTYGQRSAASSHSDRSKACAALASAAIVRPFQSVSILSSNPGRTRRARRA